MEHHVLQTFRPSFRAVWRIMQLLEWHIAKQQDKPIRLQEYAVGIFTSISTKSGIKKAIKKGLLKIDNNIALTSTFIFGGEHLFLYQEINKTPVFEFPLEIFFEDDYLAIIQKPAGIVVSANKHKTIANALAFNLQKSTQKDSLPKPLPVHRLDYPTSGLLLIAKTNTTVVALNKLFQENEIKKEYHAITINTMQKTGTINAEVDSKEAETSFKILNTIPSERFTALNLVKLQPKTGRKHQLRKHMAFLKNPILGDKLYGKEPLILQGKGLFLHASALTFTHPITTKNITVTSPLPKKFLKLFKQ